MAESWSAEEVQTFPLLVTEERINYKIIIPPTLKQYCSGKANLKRTVPSQVVPRSGKAKRDHREISRGHLIEVIVSITIGLRIPHPVKGPHIAGSRGLGAQVTDGALTRERRSFLKGICQCISGQWEDSWEANRSTCAWSN
ncbi:hypothetical protein F2P79_016439 [Pimephales promelas]|nr:hypothetical protein F2P79_016439 [Pimephales promelas]